MEEALSVHPVRQIISTIWRIDPAGKKQWPSFHRAVAALPESPALVVASFDHLYWHLYDLLDEYLDPWDVRDQWRIDRMKHDYDGVKVAISDARTLNEVYDRWSNMPKEFNKPMKIGERWDVEEST